MHLILNFNSKEKEKRIEAFYSAKILIAISRIYLDEAKIHYKQIMSSITEVALWYNKQKEVENGFVERVEIKHFIELYNKFKGDKLENCDKVIINFP